MNKTQSIVFTLIGLTLSLSAITTNPYPSNICWRRDGDDGNDNNQKVEDGSAAAIADCDWNDVEEADFDCITSAASDEPERSTLNFCKEVDDRTTGNIQPSDFHLKFTEGNNPSPTEFTGDADCTTIMIGPGAYTIEDTFILFAQVNVEVTGDCEEGPRSGGIFLTYRYNI